MIKAAFFDIDGTLVPFGERSMPDDTRAALLELRARGVKLFISTGRHYTWINNLGDFEFDGYVTVNGGLVVKADGRTPIYTHPIDDADLERFVAYTERHPEITFIAVPVSGNIFRIHDNADYRQIQELLHLPDVPERPARDVLAEPIVQLMFFANCEMVQSTDLFTTVLPGCVPTSWHPVFADIVPKGSNKGIGVDMMLADHGLSLDEALAFGDGHNDMEMLRHVPHSVAMGNAAPDVKATASYVTTADTEGGIRHALKHFGLL